MKKALFIIAFSLAVLFLVILAMTIANAQIPPAKRVDASLNASCDTLTIPDGSKVQFIKIGDDVYKIVRHNPTLEKAEVNPRYRIFIQPSTTTPGNLFNQN